MENTKHVKHFKSHRCGIITFWSIVLVIVLFFFIKKMGILSSIYLTTFFTWPLILFCISIFCLIKKDWVLGIVLLVTAKFFWIPILLKTDPNLCPQINPNQFVNNYWYLLVAFIAILLIIQQIFRKENPCEKQLKWKKWGSKNEEFENGFIRSDVVFSNNEKIYFNENFKGGKFATVFGSQEIDLRKCAISNNEKAYLDLSVVFGSYIIWVPEEWSIQINVESVFSSLEDKRIQHPVSADKDMLIMNGKCIFSNLEIRN